MAMILQTTFSYAFSWMKMFKFRLKFHWSLFPIVQLTIFQHWPRYWLGTKQATSHYLNQCWLNSLKHVCGTRGHELKIIILQALKSETIKVLPFNITTRYCVKKLNWYFWNSNQHISPIHWKIRLSYIKCLNISEFLSVFSIIPKFQLAICALKDFFLSTQILMVYLWYNVWRVPAICASSFHLILDRSPVFIIQY